jgi:hypothetical protein
VRPCEHGNVFSGALRSLNSRTRDGHSSASATASSGGDEITLEEVERVGTVGGVGHLDVTSASRTCASLGVAVKPNAPRNSPHP